MGPGITSLERWEIQKEAATIRGQASVYSFSHLSDPRYRSYLIRDIAYRIDKILHQFTTQHYSKTQALQLFRQERQNLIEQNQQLIIHGVDVITDAMVILNSYSAYQRAQQLISVALAMPNNDPLKELNAVMPIWNSENGQRFILFRYVAQEQLDLRNNGLGNSKMSLEEREKLALELLNQRIIATSDPVMTPVYEKPKPKLTLQQRLEKQRQQYYDELNQGRVKKRRLKWVKIRAIYSDSWQTPVYLENLKLTAGSAEHQSGIKLNATALKSTVSGTASEAKETQNTEGGVAVFDNLQPEVSTIEVSSVAEPGLEAQITDIEDMIEARLDGLYHGLLKDMAGFQNEWQQNGYQTLYMNHRIGLVEGAQEWGEGVFDMFTVHFWSEAADTLTKLTSSALDKLYIYSLERFNSITEIFITEEGTLQNPTWMLMALDEQLRPLSPTGHINEVAREFSKWCVKGDGVITKLRYMAKYRNEILALPANLAEGDVNAIEHFVDNILVKFSPDWAEEIKNSPNYPKALAVIQEHDAVLTYVAYLSLIIEAVPPNFYSFYAGKLRAYLLLEIVMTSALAMCTLGGGAATRLGALIAQLTATAQKVKGVSHAAKAMEGFIQTLEGLMEVLQDIERLAEKLAKRDIGKFSGRSGTTLTMKKSQVKRDGKCRFCKSSQHNTPRLYRGEINYV